MTQIVFIKATISDPGSRSLDGMAWLWSMEYALLMPLLTSKSASKKLTQATSWRAIRGVTPLNSSPLKFCLNYIKYPKYPFPLSLLWVINSTLNLSIGQRMNESVTAIASPVISLVAHLLFLKYVDFWVAIYGRAIIRGYLYMFLTTILVKLGVAPE